jgi:hypothetical protein
MPASVRGIIPPQPRQAITVKWISTLPFKYGRLDADQIVDTLVRLAKPDPPGSLGRSLTLTAKMATSGGQMRDVSFKLTEGRTSDGRRQTQNDPPRSRHRAGNRSGPRHGREIWSHPLCMGPKPHFAE